MTIKAGAAQIFVTANVERNYQKIVHYLRKARDQKLDLIVFPECALSGYGPNHYAGPRDIDHVLVNEKIRGLAQEIKKYKVAAVVGTSTLQKNKFYNTALFFNKNGELLGDYQKLHLMENDKLFYAPGQRLPLFKFQGRPVGLQICFDFRFPEPWRLLAERGAALVLHAVNACKGGTWKVPVWEAHLRSRAAENGFFVVSANAAGPLQMGRSQIVDPDGLLLASGRRDTEELITAKLDLAKAVHQFVKMRRKDLYAITMKKIGKN